MHFPNVHTFRELQRPEWIEKLREKYERAHPFPHLILDDFFHPLMLEHVLNSFPGPEDGVWWKYDNALEKKLARDKHSEFPEDIREFVHELMENEFVSWLEKITGIDGLIVDHTLRGGGMHQIKHGGKLDLHVDYNFHPVTKLDRRLNVIVYLNKDWKPDWGGDLQLWAAEKKKQEVNPAMVSIQPLFNRMVIFGTTEESVHGHPAPLECPDDVTRKSIAIYYYTNGRPEQERGMPHSTVFLPRPGEPSDPQLEALRKMRAKGRLQ